MNDFSRFAGTVALVTSWGSGIGRAVALRSAGQGADIGIDDIDVDVGGGGWRRNLIDGYKLHSERDWWAEV